MFTDYDYFLLIAEELNISRAAKRAYISQQSLSKYLKHLEEEHGTPLFERKPHLALTPAGKVVLQKARQMKIIATNMQMELDEIKANHSGTIVFAASAGRCFTLLPILFPIFHERYPQVKLITHMGLTSDLEAQVANGNIDVMLGVGPTPSPQLEEIVLTEEPFYLAISDDLLMKYFPDEYPDCKIRFLNGADIREFENIPFMMNTGMDHSKRLVERYLDANQVQLTQILGFNDHETHLKLASQGCGACFFPAFLRSAVRRINMESGLQHLNSFPLKGLAETNRVAIVYSKGRRLPNYMRYFVSLLAEQYQRNFVAKDSE